MAPHPAAAAPKPAPASAPPKAAQIAPAAATSPAGGTGVLRINSRPWSIVTIDGKKIGNTPQMNVVLPAGSHSVHLVNPQFGFKKTVKVKLAPGETQTKIVDLQ
jgi:serine/threonine-protein kinase